MNNDELRCAKCYGKSQCIKLPNHGGRCTIIGSIGDLVQIPKTTSPTRTKDTPAAKVRTLPPAISDYLRQRTSV